jgi:hypothetical protein
MVDRGSMPYGALLLSVAELHDARGCVTAIPSAGYCQHEHQFRTLAGGGAVRPLAAR